jgi:hypothetical protein
MKALAELKTASSRPGLMLNRQRESLERAKIRLRKRSKELMALRGKVRDLEESRSYWKQKCEELTQLQSPGSEQGEPKVAEKKMS